MVTDTSGFKIANITRPKDIIAPATPKHPEQVQNVIPKLPKNKKILTSGEIGRSADMALVNVSTLIQRAIQTLKTEKKKYIQLAEKYPEYAGYSNIVIKNINQDLKKLMTIKQKIDDIKAQFRTVKGYDQKIEIIKRTEQTIHGIDALVNFEIPSTMGIRTRWMNSVIAHQLMIKKLNVMSLNTPRQKSLLKYYDPQAIKELNSLRENAVHNMNRLISYGRIINTDKLFISSKKMSIFNPKYIVIPSPNQKEKVYLPEFQSLVTESCFHNGILTKEIEPANKTKGINGEDYVDLLSITMPQLEYAVNKYITKSNPRLTLAYAIHTKNSVLTSMAFNVMHFSGNMLRNGMAIGFVSNRRGNLKSEIVSPDELNKLRKKYLGPGRKLTILSSKDKGVKQDYNDAVNKANQSIKHMQKHLGEIIAGNYSILDKDMENYDSPSRTFNEYISRMGEESPLHSFWDYYKYSLNRYHATEAIAILGALPAVVGATAFVGTSLGLASTAYFLSGGYAQYKVGETTGNTKQEAMGIAIMALSFIPMSKGLLSRFSSVAIKSEKSIVRVIGYTSRTVEAAASITGTGAMGVFATDASRNFYETVKSASKDPANLEKSFAVLNATLMLLIMLKGGVDHSRLSKSKTNGAISENKEPAVKNKTRNENPDNARIFTDKEVESIQAGIEKMKQEKPGKNKTPTKKRAKAALGKVAKTIGKEITSKIEKAKIKIFISKAKRAENTHSYEKAGGDWENAGRLTKDPEAQNQYYTRAMISYLKSGNYRKLGTRLISNIANKKNILREVFLGIKKDHVLKESNRMTLLERLKVVGDHGLSKGDFKERFKSSIDAEIGKIKIRGEPKDLSERKKLIKNKNPEVKRNTEEPEKSPTVENHTEKTQRLREHEIERIKAEVRDRARGNKRKPEDTPEMLSLRAKRELTEIQRENPEEKQLTEKQIEQISDYVGKVEYTTGGTVPIAKLYDRGQLKGITYLLEHEPQALEISFEENLGNGKYFYTKIGKAEMSNDLHGGRDFTILFHKNKGGIVNMIFAYRSHSSAEWRTTNVRSESGYFSKGPSGEETLTLPWDVQKAIDRDVGSMAMNKDIEKEGYGALTMRTETRWGVYMPEAIGPNKSMIIRDGEQEILNTAAHENLPNVSKEGIVGRWKMQSKLYGNVEKIVFRSKNGKYNWVIVVPKDKNIAPFIGSIEVVGKRTKYGLIETPRIKDEYSPYVFGMPSYEYPDQFVRILNEKANDENNNLGYINATLNNPKYFNLERKGPYANFSEVLKNHHILGPIINRVRNFETLEKTQ